MNVKKKYWTKYTLNSDECGRVCTHRSPDCFRFKTLKWTGTEFVIRVGMSSYENIIVTSGYSAKPRSRRTDNSPIDVYCFKVGDGWVWAPVEGDWPDDLPENMVKWANKGDVAPDLGISEKTLKNIIKQFNYDEDFVVDFQKDIITFSTKVKEQRKFFHMNWDLRELSDSTYTIDLYMERGNDGGTKVTFSRNEINSTEALARGLQAGYNIIKEYNPDDNRFLNSLELAVFSVPTK